VVERIYRDIRAFRFTTALEVHRFALARAISPGSSLADVL